MRSIVIRMEVVSNVGLTGLWMRIIVVCSVNAGRVLRCRIMLLCRIITLCRVTMLCRVVLLCRVAALLGITTAVNTCESMRFFFVENYFYSISSKTSSYLRRHQRRRQRQLPRQLPQVSTQLFLADRYLCW